MPVGYCRAVLGVSVDRRRVVPVIALTSGNVPEEIGRIIWSLSERGIEMTFVVAPVGERRIPVDADEIDIRVSPERIEMKVNIAGSVLGMMTEILGPVGGIGDVGAGADDRPDVACKALQFAHSRISARG